MKVFALLAGVLAFYAASPADARAYEESVTCESDGGGYQHCRADVGRHGDVELAKRLSKSGCREGTDWGKDRRGIWVDNGCRARFTVYSSRGGDYRDRDYRRTRGRHGGRHDSRRSERQREIEELRAEREALRREREEAKKANQCPSGARYGRCSDDERRNGCKDWKTAQGVPCKQ